MDMTGEQAIAAPRDAVWAALNDPEVLQACIPGCEELNKRSDTELEAKVRIKVGPVNARFAGQVTLTDLDPPNSYKISGGGKGGAAGFAKGGATVSLEETGDGTLLHYTVHATVGGKLAQIGSRLVDATARKMAEQFFDRFAEHLQTAPEVAAEVAEAAAPPPPPAALGGLSPWLWVAGLVAVVAILLMIFAG
jgi:carbon monoxide dehydrogenase subunit G